MQPGKLSIYLLFLIFILRPIPVTAGVLNAESTLPEKLGQMLLIGFRGTAVTPDSYILKVMQQINIGGVVLFDYDVPTQSFPRNIIDPVQTKKLISSLQAEAQTPLFIAVDAEGGKINRLKEKYGFIPIPSAQETVSKKPEQAALIYTGLARQLGELGINFNLAPVVDLNLNPDNPIIGALERSFSARPEKVIELAEIFINVHRKAGVITALKHFPGHGGSRRDSHLGMVDVTQTFSARELLPFQELIERDRAYTIMTAHIINTNVDPKYPATLSPRHLKDLLRGKLGFTGVIISDDLQMEAISSYFGLEEAVIRAVNAGCDLLAIANNGKTYTEKSVFRVFAILQQAVKQGKITRDRIEVSWQRIKNLKQKFGIIPAH